jgi:hypothetical protein
MDDFLTNKQRWAALIFITVRLLSKAPKKYLVPTGVPIFTSVLISCLFSLVTTVMLTQQQELGEQSNTGNLCFGSGLDPDSIWSVDSDPGGKNEPQK